MLPSVFYCEYGIWSVIRSVLPVLYDKPTAPQYSQYAYLRLSELHYFRLGTMGRTSIYRLFSTSAKNSHTHLASPRVLINYVQPIDR